MGRKSSVSRMQPDAKKYLERLLRDDRHTLSELLAMVREKFPDESLSQSGIYRHKVKFDDMMSRARDQQALASIFVEELGENPDDKAGALMVQSITTLTTHAALAAAGEEDVDIDSVRKLARAAKDVIQARKVDRQERIAIRESARQELLAEQQANLEKIAKTQGMSKDQLDFWIKDFLGVR